jgi:hypothetical protein
MDFSSAAVISYRMRWRTPIAGFVILCWLTVYLGLALSIADFLPKNLFLETVFYILAGLAWIPGVMFVLGWARRDPSP